MPYPIHANGLPIQVDWNTGNGFQLLPLMWHFVLLARIGWDIMSSTPPFISAVFSTPRLAPKPRILHSDSSFATVRKHREGSNVRRV